MRLAPSIARTLTADGTLVLSGLLPRDVPGVLSAYAAQGWRSSDAPTGRAGPPWCCGGRGRAAAREVAAPAAPSVCVPGPRPVASPPPTTGLETMPSRFQSFDDPSERAHGAARIERLRAEMTRRGYSGFVVPRADEHQSEYVPPSAERLAWLTGFTGSAGTAVVLLDKAASWWTAATPSRPRRRWTPRWSPRCRWPRPARGLDRGEPAPGRSAGLRSLAAHGGRGEAPGEGRGARRGRSSSPWTSTSST
jgi:hypothetical protein